MVQRNQSWPWSTTHRLPLQPHFGGNLMAPDPHFLSLPFSPSLTPFHSPSSLQIAPPACILHSSPSQAFPSSLSPSAPCPLSLNLSNVLNNHQQRNPLLNPCHHQHQLLLTRSTAMMDTVSDPDLPPDDLAQCPEALLCKKMQIDLCSCSFSSLPSIVF